MISESNKSKYKVPVIVISSHLMGYGVTRSLGIHGIPIDILYYHDMDFGYYSKYVNNIKKTVSPESNEEIFINDLKEMLNKYDSCLIIPADDDSMKVVSKHRDKLPSSAIVACTDNKITDQFIQKEKTYKLAKALAIPHPKTDTLNNTKSVQFNMDSFQYPCLLKPNESHLFFEHYKKKMVFAYSKEDMQEMLKQFIKDGYSMLVQEYIPGPQNAGVNHNVYAVNGEILVDFTAEKVRTAPTEYSIPRVVISKNIPIIREYSKKLLKEINFSGYACIEYKKDSRDEIYKFMEINGRFNRSSLLSIKCGINFPWIMYQHLVNGVIPEPMNFKENVYWIDLTQDIFKTIKFRAEENFTFKELIRPYFNSKIFAIYNLHDMRPFLKRLTSGLNVMTFKQK